MPGLTDRDGERAVLDRLLAAVRATGVQSEMELAFAAMHQLCVPMLILWVTARALYGVREHPGEDVAGSS